MERTEITKQVINIIADQLGLTTNEIKEESHLRNDLGADSIDEVEITMALEKEFGINIPDEEIDKMITAKDITDIIQSKL